MRHAKRSVGERRPPTRRNFVPVQQREEQPVQQFDCGISSRKSHAAKAAASPELEPADDRDVVLPQDSPLAVRTARRWADDASQLVAQPLVFWDAIDADIQ